MSDDQHNIFTEPPDELGEYEFHFGTFAVGAGGMNEFEVARAFGEAADRLWLRRPSGANRGKPPTRSCFATGTPLSCISKRSCPIKGMATGWVIWQTL